MLYAQPVQPIISVDDRKFNTEAFIISFAFECSMTFSKVSKLLEFAQFLSKDSKALNRVKMERTAATYHHNALITLLKERFFSSIIVSCLNEEKCDSVVEHYDSIECTIVNAATLFQEISNLFERDEIPWDNLISDLSVSANYMQGKRSGLETKPREKPPQLLDIDLLIILLRNFSMIFILIQNIVPISDKPLFFQFKYTLIFKTFSMFFSGWFLHGGR